MKNDTSRSGGMSVDAMRAVDYWAGVPLCALSTLLLRPFRRAAAGKPRNVLFVELSEMGSAVLADPAMRAAKAAGAELHFAIFAKNKPSLDVLRTVPDENVFLIRPDSAATLLVDTVRFLAWCRRKRIDTVVDLELFSRYTALLAGWSGADRVVGFHPFHTEGLYRGEMMNRRVAYNPHVHIARNFLSLVHAAWADGDEVPFAKTRSPDGALALSKAPVDAAARASARRAVLKAADGAGRHPPMPPLSERPVVLVNANASDLLPQRRWPRERYAELIRRVLAHRPDALVLLTGSKAERDGLALLEAQVGDPRCVNFAGSVSFDELIALYGMSAVMVSNDSGPPHFAAATDMPTVVLFGPETPALYGSLGASEALYAGLHCSPCVSAANHRKTACEAPECLLAISVEQVFAAVRRQLDQVRPGEGLQAGRLPAPPRAA